MVSHLEDVDAVAVYTPIFGLNAMIANHLGRWGPSVQDTIELLRSDTVAQVMSAVDYQSVEPSPPPDRRLRDTSSWINYFLDRDSRPQTRPS